MSNTANIVTTKDLQVYLDNKVSAFKKADWIGELKFEGITIDYGRRVVNNCVVNNETRTGTIDICQFIPGGHWQISFHHNCY